MSRATTRRFERPPKSTAKDVIDYEIAMMEHCCSRTLEAHRPNLSGDDLAFLEAFLLHFRILLEFFGKPKPFPDNLHFQKPETCGAHASDEARSAVAEHVGVMEQRWGKRLNKFLAHPTQGRYTTPRDWPVEEMRAEMRQLVTYWRDCWNAPTGCAKE
jgi:hypothetical protein